MEGYTQGIPKRENITSSSGQKPNGHLLRTTYRGTKKGSVWLRLLNKVNSRPELAWHFILMITLICFEVTANQTALAADNTEEKGDKLQNLILVLGLGSTIFYEEGNEGTKQFFQSFVTSQLVTEGLKIVTDKERPNGGCCKSFPSGHTSKAFMGASFIHKRYGLEYGISAYVAATYVGYSRVQADKHYVEDVVAGAAIGILSSFYFTKPYNDIEVTPVVGNGFYGINISYKW